MTAGAGTEQAALVRDVALRDDLVLGPPLVQGRAVVHFLHDRRTGGYYRIGSREAFLVEGLLAGLGLDGAQERYERRFGRPVPAAVVQGFVAGLGRRGLLVGAPEPVLTAITERVAAERRIRGPLHARLPVEAFGRAVRAAAPRLIWAVTPIPVVVGSLLGGAVLVWALTHLGALLAVPRSGVVAVGVAVVLALNVAVHELFHGVACVRAGGRPRDVGLLWRAPVLAAFCSIDDVVIFHRTRDRVLTAYAGTYVNLAALPGAWLLWSLAPDGGALRSLAAGWLLMGTVLVVVNLIPVFGLDGYRMIEHATGTYRLQSSSFAYAAERLRGSGTAVPRRLAALYWGYAGGATVIGVVGVTAVVLVWWRTLAGLWGPTASTVVLTLEAAIVVGLVLAWRRYRGRSAAGAGTTSAERVGASSAGAA